MSRIRLFQSENLKSPIVAINANEELDLAAAITDAGELSIFSLGESNATRICKISLTRLFPGFMVNDIVFKTDQILVVGSSGRIEGRCSIDSLALAVVSLNGEILDQFTLDADPPFAPCLTQSDAPEILIGSMYALLSVNVSQHKETYRLELEDDAVPHRGLLTPKGDQSSIFLLLEYQSGTRISNYQRNGSEYELNCMSDLIPYYSRGAVLSGDGQLLAATFNNISSGNLTPDSEGAMPIGVIQVYRTNDLRLHRTHRVCGKVTEDLVLQNNVSKLEDGHWVPMEAYAPRDNISNPVFVSAQEIAFGTPSGTVHLLNIDTNDSSKFKISGAPIVSVALNKQTLVCGCADGVLHFTTIR